MAPLPRSPPRPPHRPLEGRLRDRAAMLSTPLMAQAAAGADGDRRDPPAAVPGRRLHPRRLLAALGPAARGLAARRRPPRHRRRHRVRDVDQRAGAPPVDRWRRPRPHPAARDPEPIPPARGLPTPALARRPRGRRGRGDSTIAHAAGPILALYLLAQRLEKTSFVATTGVFFTVNNLLKVPPYVATGLIDRARSRSRSGTRPPCPSVSRPAGGPTATCPSATSTRWWRCS